MIGSPAASAERFWEVVGFREPFPRSLEAVVALALPVSIIRLPRLTPVTVVSWLRAAGVEWQLQVQSRPLRGCLIAHKGHGLIFVDGALPPPEVRVTIGHEVAHFLQHYVWRREAAIARFGDSILPVLDGDRPATPLERLSGVFQGVELGPCTHLLDRGPGGVPREEVVRAEDEADLLAFELLAPASTVLGASRSRKRRRELLETEYGLPPWAAELWARHLEARKPGTGVMSQLRKAAQKS